MKLEEVLPAYREGKKIIRRARGMMLHSADGIYTDLLADDWEIIEENPYETGTVVWAIWETEHGRTCVNGRGLRFKPGYPVFICSPNDLATYADFYAKDWRHA